MLMRCFCTPSGKGLSPGFLTCNRIRSALSIAIILIYFSSSIVGRQNLWKKVAELRGGLPSQTIDHFLFAQEKGLLTDRAYLQALADCRRLARDEGLDATMAERQLDAVVALTGAPAWQEGKLLRLAYAFEQATQVRRPPQYLSSVAYG